MTVAIAYALGFLLMGCVGYVLGVAHEKWEQRCKLKREGSRR